MNFIRKVPEALVLIGLTAPVFVYAQAPDGMEVDALNLADATSEAPPPERKAWRAFTEAALGQVRLHRFGQPDSDHRTGRVSLDLAVDASLGQGLRAVLANRLDRNDQPEALGGDTVNTLKEAYLSWQPRPDLVLDAGRVNLRYGAAMGYNPTDFFREGANRVITSFDPNAIRDNRLGVAMLRGQWLWPGGALTALVAPKVAEAPNPDGWSADFGATNNRRRWLLSVSHPLADGFSPQFVVFGDRRQPVQLGLNLSALLNDRTVAHLEWSGGRQKSLLAQALPAGASVAQDESFRNRLALGFTHTNASKLSVTLELHYNGAALDEAAWNALRSSAAPDYAGYRQWVEEQLDLSTRRGAFVRLSWQDALVNRLDLSAMLRHNLDDDSQLTWLEARYRFEQAEIALQWMLASGDDSSDYGAMAQRRYLQALLRAFF